MTDKLKSPSQEGVELDALTPIFDIPPSYEFVSGAHLREYDEKIKELMNGAAIGGFDAQGRPTGNEAFPFELKFDETFVVTKEDDDSLTVTTNGGASAMSISGQKVDGTTIDEPTHKLRFDDGFMLSADQESITVTYKDGGGTGGSGTIIVKGTGKGPQDPTTYPNVHTMNFMKGAKLYPPAQGVTSEVMVDFGFEVSNEGTIIDTNKIEFIGMEVKEQDGKAVVSPIGTDKLTDRHFTIFTVKNGLSAWTASSAALPYSLIQDPMCNVAVIDGGSPNYSTTFLPQTTGMYALTKYVHFTGKEEWQSKKATVEFKLQRTGGDAKVQFSTEVTADSRGEFPTVKFYKSSVSLDKNEALQVMVKITVDGVAISEENYGSCEMDPYKNLLCLEKSGSKTHTGYLITTGLFDSLGGVSFQPGVEIRGEKNSDDTYTVGAESFNKLIVVVTDKEL